MNRPPFPHSLSTSSSFSHFLSIFSQPGYQAATSCATLQGTESHCTPGVLLNNESSVVWHQSGTVGRWLNGGHDDDDDGGRDDESDDISRGRMLVTIVVIELGQRALLVGGGRPFDSANGATRLLSWWRSVIMIENRNDNNGDRNGTVC